MGYVYRERTLSRNLPENRAPRVLDPLLVGHHDFNSDLCSRDAPLDPVQSLWDTKVV